MISFISYIQIALTLLRNLINQNSYTILKNLTRLVIFKIFRYLAKKYYGICCYRFRNRQ
jgi:hypothetical protein